MKRQVIQKKIVLNDITALKKKNKTRKEAFIIGIEAPHKQITILDFDEEIWLYAALFWLCPKFRSVIYGFLKAPLHWIYPFLPSSALKQWLVFFIA